MNGFIPVKGLERARHQDRDPVRVDDRVDLRDLLADGHVRGGDQDVGDRHRDRDRGAVGEVLAQPRLEQLGHRGLAQEADAQRGERDPELARREVLVEVVMQVQRAARAGMAVVGHLLQCRAA
jgi:hypothetical protein